MVGELKKAIKNFGKWFGRHKYQAVVCLGVLVLTLGFCNVAQAAEVKGATNTECASDAIGESFSTQIHNVFKSQDDAEFYAVATPGSSSVNIGSAESKLQEVPYSTGNNNGLSETIYTAQEIGGSGTIYSIAYNVDDVSSYPDNDIKIYMMHTAKSSFSGGDDWFDVSGASLVAEKNTMTLGANSGWETITLDTPFVYNGSDNLAIIVSKTNTSSNSLYYKTSGSAGCLQRQSNDDATYADPTNTSISGSIKGRPDIKISMYHGKILSFYYDNEKSSRVGTVYSNLPLNATSASDWSYDADRSSFTNVIFDGSCSSLSTISSYAYMLSGFVQLTNVDISTLPIDGITNVSSMFYGSSALRLIFRDDNWSGKSITSTDMFAGCISLPHFNASYVDKTYAYPDNGVTGYFAPKTPVITLIKGDEHVLDFKNESGVSITEISGIYGTIVKVKPIFEDGYICYEIRDSAGNTYTLDENGYFEVQLTFIGSITVTSTLPIEPYVVFNSNDGSLSFYYDNKKLSRTGTIYGVPAASASLSDVPWNSKVSDIQSVVFDATFKNYNGYTSTAYWFYNCENTNLTSIDCSNMDTSNVTNMAYMFAFCSSLTNLNVAGFNTSKVTNMYRLFNSCSSLTSLDVTNFNTSNVINMSAMFHYCTSLTSLDVTKFYTSKAADMSCMFCNCCSLTSLDVTKFNTSNVTNMAYMFAFCTGFTSLDVNSFDISKVMFAYNMFQDCSNLANIYCNNNWSTSTVLTNSVYMFKGCTSLPNFYSAYIDKSFAYPNNGSSGYFTAKTAKTVKS